MHRLTYESECRYEAGGPGGKLGGHYIYSSNCSPKAIIERLGEYEDLGYSPGELKAIIKRLDEFQALSYTPRELKDILEHAYVPLLIRPKDVEE